MSSSICIIKTAGGDKACCRAELVSQGNQHSAVKDEVGCELSLKTQVLADPFPGPSCSSPLLKSVFQCVARRAMKVDAL